MEVRERVETLGDLWLWVAEAGPSEAPPILLLHGLYDRWETWEPVVPALAERFRVIAFDMRGHGRSSQPAGGIRCAIMPMMPCGCSRGCVRADRSS